MTKENYILWENIYNKTDSDNDLINLLFKLEVITAIEITHTWEACYKNYKTMQKLYPNL